MRRARLTLAATLLLLPAGLARGQTSYPMLTRVEPVAVHRGDSVELSIAGNGSFADASALLCEEPGLSGKVRDVEAPRPSNTGRRRGRGSNMVKVSLSVAADAPLGPREIRVATPQGVSSIGLVVVVDDPVVREADDRGNDQPDTAQSLKLPTVVSGTIGKTEDVDWYAFEAAAGQKITFSVWANRLENKIHDLQTHFDPIVAIHDARGRELAVDDNHDFADPRLTYEFKQAGLYLVQVRDTTYAGNANWTYALQATAGPVATAVFPLAVNPGARTELHALGVNLDPAQVIGLEVPGSLAPGPQLLALPTAQGPTLPVSLVATALPVVAETGDAAAEPAQAQQVKLPAAVSGRLEEANDVDGFRFEAKKGQTYAFEVFARRTGTATDPVVRVLDARGKTLAEADDAPGSKDPRLEWSAPGDGTFTVQVADLHSRGGEEFGYVLEAQAARPDFDVTCDPDKINVGPGGRVPLFIQVARRAGFKGPVTLRWEGLPSGVSASPLTIPPEMTQGVSVVSAAADARPAAALLSLSCQGESADGTLTRTVDPRQEIYIPGGGRGLYPVKTIALGVTSPSDITVEARPAEITLKPGGTATIDVTVTRHGGYDKGVNLAILLQHLGRTYANPLPPGVSIREAGSKTLLGPKETAGKIVLVAKPDAPPCDGVPIAVMGHVSINFVVKTAYSSAPILLTIPAKAK
jgi:hypothetical protein